MVFGQSLCGRRGAGRQRLQPLCQKADGGGERVPRGVLAQSGREPDGEVVGRVGRRRPAGVLVRLPGGAGERREGLADGPHEVGEELGGTLAGVSRRDQGVRLLRLRLARDRAQPLAQRTLAALPAQVRQQELHAQGVDLVAERLRRLLIQEVRLVDDHILERRQCVAAGEQQGVVDAHQVRRIRAAARQAPVAAAALRAVAPEARGARGAELAREVGEGWELARGAVGKGGEVDVAAARPADEVGECEGTVAIRQGSLLRRDRLVQPAPADVVLAPHQQGPAPAVWKHLGDQRELVRGELALQRLGLGADDDAAPGGGAVERRR